MRTIKLQDGRKVVVDNEDYQRVLKFNRWYAYPGLKTWYARATTTKRSRGILMHRFILGVRNPNILIDHKNTNGLDNRKKNLRMCDRTQNLCNTGLMRTNTSGFKGVSWDPRQEKWVAKTRFRRKYIHIGRFLTKIAAAKAYDAMARKLFGEFARTNAMMGNIPRGKL